MLCALVSGTACGGPVSAEELSGIKAAKDSPVGIGLTLKGAGVEGGVQMRVEIANVSDGPYSLSVCPYMLLCCVKDLHPVIAV